jgi:hypothetical protein
VIVFDFLVVSRMCMGFKAQSSFEFVCLFVTAMAGMVVSSYLLFEETQSEPCVCVCLVPF